MYEKIFRKYIPKNFYDENAFNFQKQLSEHINSQDTKFKVNKILYEYDYKNFNVIESESIDEGFPIINKKFAELLGKAMGNIHSFSQDFNIQGKRKEKSYNNMNDWNNCLNNPLAQDSYKLRKNIINILEEIHNDQPKLMIHRDFRLHNIIFDILNSDFYLIDFDFAAIDYIAIEVMGLLDDFTEHNLDICFLYIYMENFTLPKHIMLNMPDTYLRYLCSNAFPFYAYNDMSESRYYNIANERNNRLTSFLENYKKIKQAIYEYYQ